MAVVPLELTTVADDEAVAFAVGSPDDVEVRHWVGLDPDTTYDLDGIEARTLPRPPGERLALVATVNDVHFGEEVAGVIEGSDIGPVFRSAPGADPYPEVMNTAAVAEMAAAEPDAVVVKGDLTADGTPEEYERFLDVYGSAFGERLHHVRGNHDAYRGQRIADHGPVEVTLPGVVLAVLDTTRPYHANGHVPPEQLEWLDELAARADRPVLVFGHHHVWSPESSERSPDYFGVNPGDSEHLIELVARRPSIVGYFAGHTHRNRVRRFRLTGDVPWVEVACVKDFPGAWAEYRVHEGGILQVFRRISAPEALAWSEQTRLMYAGTYEQYAFGTMADRCFPIWPRA